MGSVRALWSSRPASSGDRVRHRSHLLVLDQICGQKKDQGGSDTIRRVHAAERFVDRRDDRYGVRAGGSVEFLDIRVARMARLPARVD